MISTKYVFMLVMLVLVGSMHDKILGYERITTDEKHYELVKKYLLNDSSLAKSNLPILWIHVETEINARWWESFYSRNTKRLNQPYQHLTIKRIVDKCGGSFNVCLIDDDTFSKIIPGWTTDMSKLASPIKEKIREMAIARILHSYGGVLMPSTFICFEDFYDAYIEGTAGHKMFIGEFVNRSISSTNYEVYPNTRLMGCLKNCSQMEKYINYLERNISSDYTNESVFSGAYADWCKTEVENNNIRLIRAEILGALDTSNKLITIDRLLKNTYINISPDAIGLYIPESDILSRTAYNWFARMNAEQVLASDTFVGKLLLTNCGCGL